ncbi:MAG: cytochrome c biogenesis protein CcdA [Candidatus Omnitrophota bacterium]
MNLTGSFTDLFIVFTAGVIVSFTPCVYPVMPLTAAFIARANTTGSHIRAFFLSLVFVSGLAVTYSIFGIGAALAGKVFGQFQNQPWMYGIISALLLFFALITLDILSLPYFGLSIQSRIKPGNIWAVLLFGATSGLVVGPCTAPILGTILIYIAARENFYYGAFLMLLFSYGVGFSLILVGTFSGALSILPKTGPWMIQVKHVSGFIILAAASWFFLKAIGIII